MLTSNPPPPFSDSGYMRKVIDRHFAKAESHKEDDPIAIKFKEFLRTDLIRLGHLGNFRNSFVMNNQEIILDETRPLPLDLGLKMLTAAYTKTGRKMPEWLKQRLPENQLEESLGDSSVIVKRSFETYVETAFNHWLHYFRMKDSDESGKSIFSPPDNVSDRLVMMVDAKLLPDIKRAKNGDIIIRKGILVELYKYGVTKDQLPNLKALNDYLGLSAENFRKSMGNKVVSCTAAQLTEYFDKAEGYDE